MKIESLRDLIEVELCYAYDCEQKLVKKGLPTMIEAASSPELRLGLEQHLQETRSQVSRLERVISIIGTKADTGSNDGFDKMTNTRKTAITETDSTQFPNDAR